MKQVYVRFGLAIAVFVEVALYIITSCEKYLLAETNAALDRAIEQTKEAIKKAKG